MNYWLFKSEPEAWSWDNQIAKGASGEPWSGVRNYQANNYMKQMQQGDLGFFYHSVKEKQIVGIVSVIKCHYPDPSDETGRFGMVDVMAVQSFKKPVTLSMVKQHDILQKLPLVSQSRLSVMPIDRESWDIICHLGQVSAVTK